MSLRVTEKGFVVFSLVFFTGAITITINGGVSDLSGIAALLNVALSFGITGVVMFLMVTWWKRFIPIVIRANFLWVLVAIAVASVFWSDAPSRTLSNVINLIRLTLFGVYFGVRHSLKEQLRLLAWALGICALLSLVLALALPSYGVMGRGSLVNPQTIAHAGAWQGAYGHKNPLGRIMTLSTLIFLLFDTSNRRYRWVGGAGFCVSFVLILGSTSKTSLIISLTLMALLPFYRALRWKYNIALPFFISVILLGGSIATLLVSNAEGILGAFGRDVTLTGRTPLWGAVIEKIEARPWLGYGYAGFWRGFDGESGDVWRVIGWHAPHSHNGYLDLGLDLGLVGLSAFALSFLAACLQAVRWVRLTKTTAGLWPLAYLTFLLLANLTESSFFRQNTFWILYVAVTISLQNEVKNMVISNALGQSNFKSIGIKIPANSNDNTSV